MMIQINSPHFSAGVVLTRQGRLGQWVVDQTAPILKYMVGWGQTEVCKYCNKKGWDYEIME